MYRPILSVALLSLGSLGILAGEKGPTELPLAGTLEAAKKGWVKLILVNISAKPIRFLDVGEGSAFCDKVWRVEIQVDQKKLPPSLLYAPATSPFPVTLKPGQKYTREFQFGAYVPFDGHEGKQAEVRVHYEVFPDFLREIPTPVSSFRFSTNAVKLKLER